jgi:formylglycine-generating enzyme required for sulfatase activity
MSNWPRVWEILDTLLDDFDPSQAPNRENNYYWSVWLAARLANTLSIHTQQIKRPYRPIYDNLRNWIKFILLGDVRLPPVERAELGDILGLLGDDRKGVHLIDKLPDIDWCEIPSGDFHIGVTEEDIDLQKSKPWAAGWGFNRETPARHMHAASFYISRYPITQIQFKAFVVDGGYTSPEWWTKPGWEWLKENKVLSHAETSWGDQLNLPQTNVSWYEAMAFCRWLGKQVSDEISLPTEMEWERAARGADGRAFTWGDEFDTNYCNAEPTHIGRVCSVGCFPGSEGPWLKNTPSDMCGNVWEWCTTIYEEANGKEFSYPYDPEDGREDLELGDTYMRVLRGGCYLNVPFVVRTTFRGRDKPNARYGRQGFRVVKRS